MRLVILAYVFFFAGFLHSQTEFPYKIQLIPHPIAEFDGLHSFVYGQYNDYWCLIGGRTDGIHARQPFNAFPAEHNNQRIYVIKPDDKKVWSSSLSSLSTNLREQLQSSNMQFYQDGDQLIVVGGYGYSTSSEEHLTFPFLTKINLPGLIESILTDENIASHFIQKKDDFFAVTGGNLGKIGNKFYLVAGHRFDGRYNPMGHPSFVQTYTDAIRTFELKGKHNRIKVAKKNALIDPVHFHRRDNNLLSQIFPDGRFGYTIFSGVFQINQDLPFLHPVDIGEQKQKPIPSFNQYLCNYHCAHIPLFDSEQNAMHNLFFGGISRYYYSESSIIEDDDVPFVKTISRVSRDKNGVFEEVIFNNQMPAFLGSNSEFLINHDLPFVAKGIIDIASVKADSILLGYIVGGIQSEALNPFVFNNPRSTSASSKIFQIRLIKNSNFATAQYALDGYHEFSISSTMTKQASNSLRVTLDAPEKGYVEIYLSNKKGELIVNETIDGISKGSNTIELEKNHRFKGNCKLTLLLNGKYCAIKQLDFSKN